MLSEQSAISNAEFEESKPVFETTADWIMAYLSSLSPDEISNKLGVSKTLAIKARSLAYDFPHKATGNPAIYSFIGEAYRALDFKSLPKAYLSKADNSLRIISSIYGILKPSDIIKPYRCEYNKEITPNNQTSIKLYKSKNTIEFVKYIKENKIKEIIDLLPADADKCLDWKIIRAFASVYKISFKEISQNGELKTPIASKLKEMRGRMYRSIIENSLETFSDLKLFYSNHFVFSPIDSKPGLPVFIISS